MLDCWLLYTTSLRRLLLAFFCGQRAASHHHVSATQRPRNLHHVTGGVKTMGSPCLSKESCRGQACCIVCSREPLENVPMASAEGLSILDVGQLLRGNAKRRDLRPRPKAVHFGKADTIFCARYSSVIFSPILFLSNPSIELMYLARVYFEANDSKSSRWIMLRTRMKRTPAAGGCLTRIFPDA